ncbi:hypothetical protein QN277_004537 [Acacia crassicarpa]|uniref:Uncharacterized protein n=1 Tax=Acacia crassicarpa TaxID=499986 RepID=A0AAE1J361_9FABA|nr:hypothetical protein QN277_004537 [Acacia crassicarpa]
MYKVQASKLWQVSGTTASVTRAAYVCHRFSRAKRSCSNWWCTDALKFPSIESRTHYYSSTYTHIHSAISSKSDCVWCVDLELVPLQLNLHFSRFCILDRIEVSSFLWKSMT